VNAPEHVTIHAATGRLSLTWHDGQTQWIDNATLRERCPCSACRRVAHSDAAARNKPPIAILDIQPMGYGVRIVFSDGHAQGIYPWDYLADIARTLARERTRCCTPPRPTTKRFGKYDGQSVKVGGNELLALREEDVVAVVTQ